MSSAKLSLAAQPRDITFEAQRSAVMVIDMQNYDVKPAGWFDRNGIVPVPLATA